MTKRSEQEIVWEKLKHVPSPSPMTFDFDVSSMYAAQVFVVNQVEPKEGELVTLKVLKNRYK